MQHYHGREMFVAVHVLGELHSKPFFGNEIDTVASKKQGQFGYLRLAL